MPDANAIIERDLDSPDETARFGEGLAHLLRPGDTVLLVGPLGSGKTTLVRAIAAALGVEPAGVSSPTFVLINEYEPSGGRAGSTPLVHVDAYRLDEDAGREALDQLGWDRAAGPGVITLIEWGERVASLLSDASEPARLELEHAGEHARHATLRAPASWRERPGFADLAGGDRPARGPTTCPVTGQRVAPDNPHWPFASERARLADLQRWFAGDYQISRPVTEADLEQGE